ncbi:ARM repeat-containing protein [Nemania sp. NC0429]|nr:ARM repeat-containing protein [Nemania sp. NC0429]
MDRKQVISAQRGLSGGRKRTFSIVSSIAWLAGGPVVWYFYIWIYWLLRRRSTPSRPASSPKPPSHERSLALTLVYPEKGSDIATDIDIIAIHGLDTDSSRTWEWKHDRAEDNVNWLAHKDMLPAEIPAARIFTCDWPAPLLESQNFVQKDIDEFAGLLLTAIMDRDSDKNSQHGGSHKGDEHRPIVFIASCLGGLVLIKSLVMAGQKHISIADATWGIVFLATPFRGTSFAKLPKWAELGLKTWASSQDRHLSKLLQHTKPSTGLQHIVSDFSQFCNEHNHLTSKIIAFYETGKTSLPRKIARWLPSSLAQEQPLVDQHSATLDFFQHKLPLDRVHVQMNKFSGTEDPGYKLVATKIRALIRQVRNEQLLQLSKLYIGKTCYSKENLKIQRLSGDQLPMDQCYINLFIVENPKQESESPVSNRPVSLFAHLGAESPQSEEAITLSKLFDPRGSGNGEKITNRRTLIYGRAGVGKTTLCKKIVYDFTYGNLWQDLFDCVLWIPLRRLKAKARLDTAGYNFEHLFLHEFFHDMPERRNAAKALENALKINPDRFLFLLDGLDEAPQDPNCDMSRFIEQLLNQTNVIVTSRPNVALPPKVQKQFRLRLEAIGFYPDQINDYVEAVLVNPETNQPNLDKVKMIQSRLNRHHLTQGLMRIPIQLDAFCYTWESFHHSDTNDGQDAMQDSITAIYVAIEEKLWGKDIREPNKFNKAIQQTSGNWEILSLIEGERHFLELLAFNGMYYDVIDFEPEHRQKLLGEYQRYCDTELTLDTMLAYSSFTRSSDAPFRRGDRNYHFIHLTFQEYFGARYFARQWETRQPLKCVALSGGGRPSGELQLLQFLGENKYSLRYDVFWRFVAGLLNAQCQPELPAFFQAIEAEPRDLLGPAHQRLISHCLPEVSTEQPFREKLEDELSQWAIRDCKEMHRPSLAPEIAISRTILDKALRQDDRRKVWLLKSFCQAQNLSEGVFWAAATFMGNENWDVREQACYLFTSRPFTEIQHRVLEKFIRDKDVTEALRTCIGHKLEPSQLWALREVMGNHVSTEAKEKALEVLQRPKQLDEIRAKIKWHGCRLSAVKPYLENKLTREPVLEVLSRQPTLSEELIPAVAACLNDRDHFVRIKAGKLLEGRRLPEDTLRGIVASLNHEHEYLRDQMLKVLAGQPSLSNAVLKAIATCLGDAADYVRYSAICVLDKMPNLSEEVCQIIAARMRVDSRIRGQALRILIRQSIQSGELMLDVATCINGSRSNGSRYEVLSALRDQPALPDNVLEAIASHLEDEVWSCYALEALQTQPNLPGNVLEAISGCLKDERVLVRQDAIDALKGRPTLPNNVLQTIAACFKDKVWLMEYYERGVREGWPTWPKELNEIVKDCLKDEDSDSRQEAENICLGRPTLSKQLLKFVIAGPKHKEAEAQRRPLNILMGHKDLPNEFLDAILEAFEGHGEDIAAQLLKDQPHLEKRHIKKIGARVGKSSFHARDHMAELLIQRQALGEIEDVASFYKAMVYRAMSEHVAWVIIDGHSHITVGQVKYSQKVPVEFEYQVREAQKRSNIAN